MNIHILPSVGDSLLQNAVTEAIVSSGNQIGDLATSDYVLGLLDDPNWHKVQDSQRRIILKESRKIDSVPSSAILVDVFLLTMIDSPTTTLCDWLKTAPVPVAV